MGKIISICITIIIAALAGCATPAPARVGPYQAVTPNPTVRTHPDVTSTNYDAPNTYDTPVVSTYYPTGVGINVNGYGPINANYYETGFFGNF